MPADAYNIAPILQAHRVASGSEVYQGLVCLAVGGQVEVGAHMCAAEFYGHK